MRQAFVKVFAAIGHYCNGELPKLATWWPPEVTKASLWAACGLRKLDSRKCRS